MLGFSSFEGLVKYIIWFGAMIILIILFPVLEDSLNKSKIPIPKWQKAAIIIVFILGFFALMKLFGILDFIGTKL